MSEMTPETQPTELDILRETATKLGISFTPRTGAERLRKDIQDHLLNIGVATPVEPEEESSGEFDLAKVRGEALKLVRIRISCMNPQKADLPGEIITVSNDIIGSVSRFVPYQGEAAESWHVEQIIYDHLASKEFLQISTGKSAGSGKFAVDTPTRRFVKEFNIQVLPPLTPEELKELALEQAAKESVTE